MKKLIPALSWGMLVIGGFLVLAGLGWGIWLRVNAPPPPVITEQGAVVLAETAPPQPTTAPPTITPSPTNTVQPPSEETEVPVPELLPEWTVTPPPPEPTPTKAATPNPSPTPSPTRPPEAESPPTRIIAPSIEMDVPVKAMGWEMVDHDGTMSSEWLVPEGAAGWHLNSALPGHKENVVLSGHHNIEGKVFRYVVDLGMGDEITLYVNDTPYVYTVTDKYILKEMGVSRATRKKNAQWILPSGDERLTLVTCWPYEWPGNSHRVIVVARPPGASNSRAMGLER